MTIEVERGKVYVVERNVDRLRTGEGLLNGLDVVIRHFWDAFTKKLDSPSKTSGVFTVQYPEERLPLPEAYRNFPILLYDDETGQELCTSCFQCERICPPQVIHMTQERDPATGKPVPAVAEFLIEYDACMSCGLCAEVCPFDAIKMDHEFELSTDVHGGLTLNKEQLNRPVSYYERLAPTMWAEVKDSAYKKLQGNVRRRSGLIGVAPQVAERLRSQGAAERAPGADGAAARPAEPSPASPPPAVPAPGPEAAAPAAPAAPASAEDKAARLAAIRARNAAKAARAAEQQDQGTPAPAEAAPAAESPPTSTTAAAAPPATSADDKAARLAAIRAANAAKKATAVDGGTSPPAAPAPENTGAQELIATPSATPADDKAARLAAIRAANAAKKAAQSGQKPDEGGPPSE